MMERYKYLIIVISVWLTGYHVAIAGNTISIAADMSIDYKANSFAIPISLNNTDDIYAVQFNLKLPHGFDTNYSNWVTCTERTSNMAVSSSYIDNDNENNIYTVMLYSSDNTPINGTEGDIINMSLRTGYYSIIPSVPLQIELSDIILTDKDGNNIYMGDDCVCNINPTCSTSYLLASDIKFNKKRYYPGEDINITYKLENKGSVSGYNWKSSVGLYPVNGGYSYSRTYNLPEILPSESTQRTISITADNDTKYWGRYILSMYCYQSNPYISTNTIYSEDTISIGRFFEVDISNFNIEERDKREYSIQLTREDEDISKPLTVNISVSGNRIRIPETVTFMPCSTTCTVHFSIINNNVVDDSNTEQINFSADGYGSAISTVRIYEDDRYGPDLVVENINVLSSDTYKPGDEIKIDFEVKNIGKDPLNYGWEATLFFVGDDGTYEIGKVRNTEYMSADIAVSGQYSLEVPEYGPFDGILYVKATVMSLNGEEVSKYTGNNTVYSNQHFSVARQFTASLSNSVINETSTAKEYIEIKRSGYETSRPVVRITSKNDRVNCPSYSVLSHKNVESIEFSAKDNNIIDESDFEELTVSIDGYDSSVLSLQVINDDIEMTDEYLHLKTFVDNTDCEAWTNKWNVSGETISTELDGITFDENHHVTAIDLSNRNIKGNLTRALFDMPYLESLSLADNELSGKVEDVLAENQAEATNLKTVTLSNNRLTGNVGAFAKQITSLQYLYVDGNCISDLSPVLSSEIKDVDLGGQVLDEPIRINFSDMTDEYVVSELPRIITYNHDKQDYDSSIEMLMTTGESSEFSSTDNDTFGIWAKYQNGNITSSLASIQNVYNEVSGAEMKVFLKSNSPSNRLNKMPLLFSFDVGDGNFDGKVDILDLQTTVNYIFKEHSSKKPLNLMALDIYNDKIVNIQDVICMVNILLDSEEENAVKAKAAYGSVANEIAVVENNDSEAYIYISDNKLYLHSQVPVSSLHIRATGNVNWEITKYGFSQTTSSGNVVAYSLNGITLPCNEDVMLGRCDGAVINYVLLSTPDAQPVIAGFINSSPTGIDEIMDVIGKSIKIYDVSGFQRDSLKRGINIIKSNGKSRKIYK